MKRYLAAAMALSAVMVLSSGAAVFAEDTVLISENQETAEVEDAAEEMTVYTRFTGKITAVEKTEDGYSIAFESNEMGELILNETENGCMVFDGAELAGFEALKTGTDATVIIDGNAPMTLSLPAQTNGAVAIVINNNAEIDKLNDEFVGEKLQLDPSENTRVLDIRGTKQILKAEDAKGRNVLVIYGVSTKSIPAITTPDFIVLLDEEPGAEPEIEEIIPEENIRKIESVALRAAFEEKGYTVSWTANDAPIVISNGSTAMEVTIGSDNVLVEGDMMFKISSPVELINGVTYVTSDIFDIFE